uniref:Reverse transcriptase domain-containing protein n=1 Tax=Strongyloides papillosus TaxID=174720 RepID=A0A0N5B904_STREA
MDDFFLLSDKNSHDKDLLSVLQVFRDLNIKLSVNKCKFGTTTGHFIGWGINSGIEIPETEGRLYSLPCPNTKEELKSTLARYQYRAQSIPQYSKFAAPLHKYTGAVRFDKSKVQNLYEKLRESIKENVKLYPIEEEAKYIKVIVEADDFAIWYSSLVVYDKEEKLFDVGSRTLKDHERNYLYQSKLLLCLNECLKKQSYLYSMYNIVCISNVKNLDEVVFPIPVVAKNTHQRLCMKLLKYNISFEKSDKGAVGLKFLQVANVDWIKQLIGNQQDKFIKFLISTKDSLDDWLISERPKFFKDVTSEDISIFGLLVLVKGRLIISNQVVESVVRRMHSKHRSGS